IPLISLVDLGVIGGVDVDAGGRVVVRLLPTFAGCPALHLMKEQIVAEGGSLPGVAGVEMQGPLDQHWTRDRIAEDGLPRLREWGLTPPRRSGAGGSGAPGLAPGGGRREGPEPVTCPYCGSRNTRLENAFGPTPCRAIHYCDDCRQPFERFKELV